MSDTKSMLDTFFHPDDQDAFARSLGWDDAAQMIYYENMALSSQQQEEQQLPPLSSVTQLHELEKIDSREAFDSDEENELDYWAGVY